MHKLQNTESLLILFAHENIKKLPSNVGYLKIVSFTALTTQMAQNYKLWKLQYIYLCIIHLGGRQKSRSLRNGGKL